MKEQALKQHQDELWKISEMREKELEDMRLELGETVTHLAKEQKQQREHRAQATQREEQIINEIEARVKRTLSAKDETINQLRVRKAALENKVREFEYLLDRQREELLGRLTQETHR